MDPLTPEDPTHVGPYRLIARLGAGGMGLVYLGRDDVGRTVAVKVVQSEYAAQPEFRRRFAREVAAARRVGGSWTADVLDANTDTGVAVPWVATQYIAGPDLTTVVARDFGPLPEHSVRVLANRLALALRVVHEAGLIHRDLKPSNVLVTVDGPRVIDFGIARAMDSLAGDSLHTRTGMLIGSPGFMSPEQVRGLELTAASDVFCLGAVLVYAATGRHLFGATDTGLNAHLFRVAEEEPDLTGVPEALLGLVRACLEKDPAARPTPERIAALTDGDGGGVWLPGEVLAQLGRHAARLLDYVPAARAEVPAEQPVMRPVAQPVTETAPRDSAPAPAPAPAYTPTAPAHEVPAPSTGRGWGLAVIVLAQLAVLLGAVAHDPFGLDRENPELYSFAVPFAALLLLGGHLADRLGARRTLVVGLTGLVAACVLRGFAVEIAPTAVLITARVLQGGFGALVTAAALTLVATAFPEPGARARAFGVYATAGIGAPIVAFQLAWLDWGPVLGIAAVLAVIALAGVRVLPQHRPDRTGTRFDLPGVLLGAFATALLMYGSIKATHGWGGPLAMGLLVGGAAVLGGFLGWQSIASHPLLPPYVLKDRNRLGGLLAMLLAGAGILALLPPLASILVWDLGYSLPQAGLALLPMVAAIAVAAVLVAPRLLRRRTAPRVLVVAGLVLTPLGVALTIVAVEGGAGYPVLLPATLLAGLGIGLAFMPLFAIVVAAGLGRHTGAAAAAAVTAQTLGTEFGAAAAVGHGGPPWWAVVCLLLAGLVTGLLVTTRATA
ncbi:bifunctional serine/threonine protein kinase/MFS transporter [Streptomyces sp. NPDC015661]|uniref:bifunctional serine/threonine protein kinase/MFS transporter n=1 Tax=Streptomyces sp. NPDC015661 TaxID=3364961 RepID=UPI0036F60C64